MAKENQKMTLNVRNRASAPEIDPAKLEAFASGAETERAGAPLTVVKKNRRQKVVRDAFTMPAADHDLFAEIQKKCLSIGMVVTKSEIVRAGLAYLAASNDKSLEKTMKAVSKVKTGRPLSENF